MLYYKINLYICIIIATIYKMKPIIVVPCYNEEEVLQDTTATLLEVLNSLQQEKLIEDGAILYIDDGSRDNTWKLIEDFSRQFPRIKGLKLAHNVGHQLALWAGLEAAAESSYDAAISIDADLQDDVAVIRDMLLKYREGSDIVYGVRKERNTDTWFKKHSAQAFYKLMRKLGGDIVYNHADFRLMSLRALQALISYPERNLFLRGLVPLLGFNTDCVYYDRKERMAGESKYPLKKMISFALDGITSFSVKPLRFITGCGVVIMLLAFGAIIYGLCAFFHGNVIPGWTSLLVSLWFIGGGILTAIGIIGEYIGKIYKEVKRRPRYFIEKRIE
jgi:glycosyltransferase involved in cell wall biosynthesis